MNKLFFIVLIFTSLTLTEEYLAVMTLEPMGLSDMEANILSERLTSKLISLKKYTVIERSNIEKILKEQKFQYSGCTDTKCAVEIGKMLNSNYIVIGNISKLGSTYSIDCRIIDVETIEALSSASFTTKGNIDDLFEGINNIALQLYGFEDYETEKNTFTIKKKKEVLSQTSGTIFDNAPSKSKKGRLYISYNSVGYNIKLFLDGDEIDTSEGDYNSGSLSIGYDYNIKKKIAIGSSLDIVYFKDENMDGGNGFLNIYSKYFLPINSIVSLWGSVGYNVPLGEIEDHDGGLSYGFGLIMSNGIGVAYIVNTISDDSGEENGIGYWTVSNLNRVSISYNFDF